MNFYIFNFKREHTQAFIIVVISYLFFSFILNTLLARYVYSLTTQDFFIQDKHSKMRHFSLQNNLKKKYVFLGTSRTLFHVNSSIFKRKNIPVYNMGMSYSGLTHQVYLINRLTQIQPIPENIVLSININELFFTSYIGPNFDNTIDDFLYALETKNLQIIYNSYLGLSQSQSLSRVNRAYFNEYIETFYKSFELSSSNFKFPIITDNDCSITRYVQNATNRALCSNGDGILMTNITTVPPQKSINLIRLNQFYIQYLNKLNQTIIKSKSKFVIVLEPDLNTYYNFDLKSLQEALPSIRIVDLSNFKIDEENWADAYHLNLKGRDIYTHKLLKSLENKI